MKKITPLTPPTQLECRESVQWPWRLKFCFPRVS